MNAIALVAVALGAHAQPVKAAAGPGLASAARNVGLVVAHRGSSADRPENTLAAYRRAIEAGAGAIEVDLRLTKDGHLVCIHDESLEATTNGSGRVSSKTLAEVRRFDAGSQFDSRYRGERVPTFQEVLGLAKGRVDVVLDLKDGDAAAYLERIVAEVRKFGEPRRTIAGVRSLQQVEYFRKYLPEARQLGLIPEQNDIERFAAAGVKVIRFWPEWLSEPGLLERLRATGAELHLSVDRGTREEVTVVLAAGPVSLFTNDPAQTLATLEALGARR